MHKVSDNIYIFIKHLDELIVHLIWNKGNFR